MKHCDECQNAVFLYIDGVTGKIGGWYCSECNKPFTDEEVEALEGECDKTSKERMGQRPAGGGKEEE